MGPSIRILLLAATLTACVAAPVTAQQISNGFVFNMPADDSTTVDFLPAFPAVPITDADFISAVGDDFHRNGEQIRFFGANFVADGAFPQKAQSLYIAPRFRKMGMNLARFHHLDNNWSDHGIFPRNGSTRSLDTVQLDRLEYLIFKLKAEGVYVNMNLHVSRTFTEADGVANADSIVDFAKGVTYFDPHLIDLQKEYASQLLGHVSPYTGRSLADDPVLAMVEITNENSLYYMWRAGQLTGFRNGGNLIQRHVKMLDALWTTYLVDKYGTTDALRTAWGADELVEGADLVVDGGFETSVGNRWQLEYHGGAFATVASTTVNPYAGSKAARVNVTTMGTEDWRVQWKQIGVSMVADTTYTIRFALRAEHDRDIPVSISKNVDPWTPYSSFTANVGTEWKTFEFTFTAPVTVNNDIRISFTMGGETGSVWVDEVSMRRAGRVGLEGSETIASAPRLPYSEVLKYSTPRLHDNTAFYIDLQNRYYEEMAEFLRYTLGVRVPINGSNWNFGLVDLASQSTMDYMDNHSYWDHPQFPNEPWSSTDWRINNTPMVREANGGTMSRLMAGIAPANKPYTISEYNHAFPNRYQTEGVLMLAAYASLHDVDGLMFFEYNGSTDWTSDYIGGFFGLNRNPAMMALMPSVAHAYRNERISEARTTLTAEYGSDELLGYPALDTGGWGGTWLFPPELALQHRVVTSGYDAPGGTNVASFPSAPSPPFVSDTNQIRWDPAGLFSVSDAGFSGITGFLDQFVGTELWGFGSLVLAEADGFGTMTWTELGWPASLITLSSSAQNSAMAWDGTSTVHDRWGSAPTQMQPLRLVLHYFPPIATKGGSDAQLLIHALGETGSIRSTRSVPLTELPQGIGFEIVLDQRIEQTPWFGIETPNLGSSESDPIGERFLLDAVYPNPALRTATVSMRLPGNTDARLEVFDLLGRRVHTQALEPGVGPARVSLDVEAFAAGLYQIRVTAGSQVRSRAFVIR